MTNTGALQSEYPSVMENAVRRLVAAEECLEELTAEPTHADSWKNCDFIALQLRKLCELMLLGSTLAHWREGTADINPKKWRPKEAFGELSQLSSHPLQVPVAIQVHHAGQGQHHAEPLSKAMPFETLNAIYGLCGDLLHIPSAKKVAAGAIPPFDVARFKGWMDGFRMLLQGHALILPGIQLVLLCRWSGSPTDAPEVFLLSALGPSTLNLSGYPEFDVLHT
jgi:hypothetical protein